MTGGPYGPVKDILAMFVAMRNYGYADMIGNALERTTVLEALGNALRDFRSLCLDASPETKKKLEEDEKVRCPKITPQELESAVEAFVIELSRREKSGDLVPFLREVYVDALARASRFKVGVSSEEKEEGGRP